jgi:membrane-associated phospholipid phosphatase
VDGVAGLQDPRQAGTRPVLRATASSLAVFVAASRVYVGVHYPSDVVGGVGIGLLHAAGWRAVRRAVFA